MTIRATLPDHSDSKRYSEAVRNFFYDGFNNFNEDYYVPGLDYKEIKSKIKSEGGRSVEFTAGYYIPSRNLVHIIVPLFNFDWSRGIEKPLEVLEGIIESLKELKVTKIDISKEIERSRIDAFMKVIKERISNTKDVIKNNQYSIDEGNKKIIDLIKQVNYDTKLIQSLVELEKQDASLITDQITKLKKVPFVKEVELTNDGIEVYIGEISLKYNKQNYVMGRYRVYIKPKEIQIFNLDAIKQDSTWYDHPHINNTKPCLNTWGTKVNDLLAKMDFVNLVIFLKMYLQSYNDSDDGHPFMKIEIWNEFRKKQLLHLTDKIPEVGKEREYIELVRKGEIKDGE